MLVREEMTAAPPVNNMEVTRMLVIMPKTVKTLRQVRFLCPVSESASSRVLQMRCSSKSSFDNFKESMCIGRASLKLNSKSGKQQDLDGGSRRIPEGPGNTILVRDGGALQEGSSPGPGRDDGGCHETRFHCSASCAEHFGGLKLMVETFEDPRDENLVIVRYMTLMLIIYVLTIPNEKRAPKPRTMPYPQPTLRGGAIGIL